MAIETTDRLQEVTLLRSQGGQTTQNPEDLILQKISNLTASLSTAMREQDPATERQENIKKAINYFNDATKLYDQLEKPTDKTNSISWDRIRTRLENTARTIKDVTTESSQNQCSSVRIVHETQKFCVPTKWKKVDQILPIKS